jgi:hypothetical protein
MTDDYQCSLLRKKRYPRHYPIMPGNPQGRGSPSGGGKETATTSSAAAGAASPRKPPGTSPTPPRAASRHSPPTAAVAAGSPRVIHVRQAQVMPDPESGITMLVRRDPRYEEVFYTTVPVGGQVVSGRRGGVSDGVQWVQCVWRFQRGWTHESWHSPGPPRLHNFPRIMMPPQHTRDSSNAFM